MHHRTRRRRGMTITELLTVVSVITILTTMMSPVLIRVHQEASRARCVANFDQISKALQLYRNRAGKLPQCFDNKSGSTTTIDEDSWWYRKVVREVEFHTHKYDQLSVPDDNNTSFWGGADARGFTKFRPERCICRCPASPDYFRDNEYYSLNWKRASSVDKDRVYDLNYGYNNHGHKNNTNGYGFQYGSTGCKINSNATRKRSTIYHTGSAITGTYYNRHTTYTYIGAYSDVPDAGNTLLMADYIKADISPNYDQKTMYDPVLKRNRLYDGYEFRHGGKCNFLFVDGHVDAAREATLRTLLADGTWRWTVRKPY